ncbi:hypothetical protein CW304_02015 [Bacillus sp. UFRGS-B20]|nr:hypothetical protein CW304_02015 [Bacillus sp. UFRGS-B20]
MEYSPPNFCRVFGFVFQLLYIRYNALATSETRAQHASMNQLQIPCYYTSKLTPYFLFHLFYTFSFVLVSTLSIEEVKN